MRYWIIKNVCPVLAQVYQYLKPGSELDSLKKKGGWTSVERLCIDFRSMSYRIISNSCLQSSNLRDKNKGSILIGASIVRTSLREWKIQSPSGMRLLFLERLPNGSSSRQLLVCAKTFTTQHIQKNRIKIRKIKQLCSLKPDF